MPLQLCVLRPLLLVAFAVSCGSTVFGQVSAPQPASVSEAPASRIIRYNRDVRPLLSDRCFHCHGPDSEKRKARLRLDRADGADGAYRTRKGKAAIRPGSLEQSEVWKRISAADPRDRMPPLKSHKAQLTSAEREILKTWILQGAKYESHWSFTTPARPEPPRTRDTRWGRNAIDAFVLRRLEDAGRKPSPRADRRTLMRRLSLDLTGLPPSRSQIRQFLTDTDPNAYEKAVDALLARPQFGEHMARYWLDLVRFADTNGVHHDHYRELTPYRDWVIRAFNRNLPYDKFVTDQLAGDLAPKPTVDQLIASGFHRLHMIIDRGTALPEESFSRNVIDRVTAVGTAFLGLTVQCAVCHDHKYDPISQRDFYRLYAFFNNIDAKPETGSRGTTDFRRGLQPPYITFPTEQQKDDLQWFERQIASLTSRVRSLREDTKEHKNAELLADLAYYSEQLRCVQAERNTTLVGVKAAMIMKERPKVRPTHVFVRGDYATPGDLVERGTPAFLPPMRKKAKDETYSRLDLAQWLLQPNHPLTARVATNRFWQQLFGTGLVKTSEDLGLQGEWPSHPELLDHLATSFVASGWDIKALLKQIVMSATYQQRSTAAPEAFRTDPENRLLARGSRFRLDAEVIRDQILATSGLLSTTMFGRSVKPPQPKGVWKAVVLPDTFPRVYEPDFGDKRYRRSIYTFWKRGLPPPQMTILNAPTRESCIARRERTNTPLQALLLLNETEYLRAARHLTRTVMRSAPQNDAQRLATIFETITGRMPDASESRSLLRAARELTTHYRRNPAEAAALCQGADVPAANHAELAGWTLVTSSIYNLDITRNRQ